MKLKIRVLLSSSTSIEKPPSSSVLVSVSVPFTRTLTPDKGKPSVSVTLPSIFCFCRGLTLGKNSAFARLGKSEINSFPHTDTLPEIKTIRMESFTVKSYFRSKKGGLYLLHFFFLIFLLISNTFLRGIYPYENAFFGLYLNDSNNYTFL